MLRFFTAVGITYAGILAIAAATDPARVCTTLVTAFGVFLLIPFVMAATLNLVALLMSVVVIVSVVVGRVVQPSRPSGAADLLRELATFGWWVVPGYWRAIGGVATARTWGSIAGCFGALVTLAVGGISTA